MGTKPKRKAAKKIGRPTNYTPRIATAICEQIANGVSLRQICTKSEMPDKSTVLRWLVRPDFRDQYAQAREAQADYWADEIVEISDDSTNDYVEREREDGTTFEAVDHEHIQRSRLRVDTRKWLMARMAPKKYSERIISDGTVNLMVSLAELVNLSFKPDLPELPPPKVIEGETE